MSRAPLRPRVAYRHWTPITTRWHDNDAYGHVNNASYYGWFDTTVDAAAEGHFTHVYVGRETRRSVALPEAWRETIRGLA